MAVAPLLAEIPAAPVLGLMVVGVVTAMVGHAARSYKVVAVGLAVLFLATAAMVVAGFSAYQGDEADPRPSKPPSEPAF